MARSGPPFLGTSTGPVALTRALSEAYGCGALGYDEKTLENWKAFGTAGNEALKRAMRQKELEPRREDLLKAIDSLRKAVALRPDFAKGYLVLSFAQQQLGDTVGTVQSLDAGLVHCPDDAKLLQERAQFASDAEPSAKPKCKVKGLKLLPHEQQLVDASKLRDITHDGSSAIWLSAESRCLEDESLMLVYRPMGDLELEHLLTRNELPATQPYQTIVVGEEGRIYAEKYLRGHKSVDSSPTTVVEFTAPATLIRQLFGLQSKNEDGAISHGLGDKGGKGLPFFNASLESGETTWRIVFVKRFVKKAVGAFGAGRKKL